MASCALPLTSFCSSLLCLATTCRATAPSRTRVLQLHAPRRPTGEEVVKDTQVETAAVNDDEQMKHIFKIIAVLAAISAVWVALLETSTVPRSYTWLLPIYLVVALGCYGLFMVGYGLMFFPTCPQEAVLLQQDIVEAKEFLSKRGVDVSSD
ncbi:hypothetical protein ZWY2020_036287 [Hordeum vulgare]|nr:hypothetical protein ZWY2020_036287 [Hordeum vulgare]